MALTTNKISEVQKWFTLHTAIRLANSELETLNSLSSPRACVLYFSSAVQPSARTEERSDCRSGETSEIRDDRSDRYSRKDLRSRCVRSFRSRFTDSNRARAAPSIISVYLFNSLIRFLRLSSLTFPSSLSASFFISSTTFNFRRVSIL